MISEATTMTLDPNFFRPFVQGALETFKVQCGLDVTAESPFIKGSRPPSEIAIAAVIAVRGENIKASIMLCFPEKVFLGTMSKMLGDEYTEISSDLRDGVAELLNIIFGQAKIVLNEQGHLIQKAIPTVITGENLATHKQPSPTIIVLPLKSKIGDFQMEFCADPTE